LKTTLWLRH